MQSSAKCFIYIILLFSQLSVGSTTTSEKIVWTAANIATANHYIIPLYKKLATSTAELQSHFDSACITSADNALLEEATLILLQEKMRVVYINWASVQHIGFGPIAFLKRKERFQYWPDKHKVGGKQIRRLLASNISLNLEQLENKSVAVQGLPALEQILFSQKGTLSVNQCKLAHLISQNLNNIAQETYQAWALPDIHFADEFRQAEHGNGFYYSSKEVAGLLLNSLSTQLKIITQLKLAYALPKGNKRAKPRSLEAWRSQLSLPLIHKNLSSLEELYQSSFESHLQKFDISLAHKVTKTFAEINNVLTQFSQPLYIIVKSNSNHDQLIHLHGKINDLYRLLSLDMAKVLNLSVGFNALDGD